MEITKYFSKIFLSEQYIPTILTTASVTLTGSRTQSLQWNYSLFRKLLLTQSAFRTVTRSLTQWLDGDYKIFSQIFLSEQYLPTILTTASVTGSCTQSLQWNYSLFRKLLLRQSAFRTVTRSLTQWLDTTAWVTSRTEQFYFDKIGYCFFFWDLKLFSSKGMYCDCFEKALGLCFLSRTGK